MSILYLPGSVLKKIRSLVSKGLKKREEKYLDRIYNRFIPGNERVNHILAGTFPALPGAEAEERGWPDKKRHGHNDWWKVMLLRYALASHYAQDKKVLDTCSGLGWGIFIVDRVAKAAAGVEIDKEAVTFAKETWPVNRTGFINGSVLSMPVKDSAYDVVLAFESIEHFELPSIKTYLNEIFRVLKPGGYVVGSSAFPDTREEADRICARNKHHLYICCKDEFQTILRATGFKRIRIFRNRLFFTAQKS